MPSRMRTHRRGMTIIEVMFAIVILSGVMLALARFGQGFTRATRNSANFSMASDLATARLETIKAHGTYATIIGEFNGTSETSTDAGANPSMTDYDGFTRLTAVAETVTDTTVFVTVTVTVTAAVLANPLAKTVIIARF